MADEPVLLPRHRHHTDVDGELGDLAVEHGHARRPAKRPAQVAGQQAEPGAAAARPRRSPVMSAPAPASSAHLDEILRPVDTPAPVLTPLDGHDGSMVTGRRLRPTSRSTPSRRQPPL